MPKQRHTEGAIVSIPLKDGVFGFALLLEDPNIKVYNYFSKYESEIEAIIKNNFLFEAAIYNSIILDAEWQKIGKKQLTSEEKILKKKFIQDILNPNEFRIYDPTSGTISDSKKEECIGMDCEIVFDRETIEKILWEFYTTGISITWKEQNKMI